MAFTKLTAELDTISQLPNTPNRTSGITGEQLRHLFDENSQAIKQYINDTLISELESANGSKNIGFSHDSFTDVDTVAEAFEFLLAEILEITFGTIPDNSITGLKLVHTSGSEAVTTDVIRDLAVTAAKIAANAITTSKLADGAVTSTKIADGGITSAKLANNAVTTDKIEASAVRAGQIQDGAVSSTKLGTASVVTEKIKDNNVTGAKIADATVTGEKLSNNSVTTEKVADSAITHSKLASDAVFKTAQVTLDADSWSNNEQTVACSGVTTTNSIIASYDGPSKDDWINGVVGLTGQGNGTLTFKCVSVPSNDITANILILL